MGNERYWLYEGQHCCQEGPLETLNIPSAVKHLDLFLIMPDQQISWHHFPKHLPPKLQKKYLKGLNPEEGIVVLQNQEEYCLLQIGFSEKMRKTIMSLLSSCQGMVQMFSYPLEIAFCSSTIHQEPSISVFKMQDLFLHLGFWKQKLYLLRVVAEPDIAESIRYMQHVSHEKEVRVKEEALPPLQGQKPLYCLGILQQKKRASIQKAIERCAALLGIVVLFSSFAFLIDAHLLARYRDSLLKASQTLNQHIPLKNMQEAWNFYQQLRSEPK